MGIFGDRLANIPPAVKYILLINVVFYVLELVFPSLVDNFALYSLRSEYFKPIQFLSHMFLHGSFWHLFFNMFSLYMFGRVLESWWGTQRFFIYYFVTGLGAAVLHLLVKEIEIQSLLSQLSQMQIDEVLQNGAGLFARNLGYTDVIMQKLNMVINVPTIGASGAVYGLLLAFGMLFPNTELYIYFAIPIKAKWMVIIFALIELGTGILNSSGDNVAHFAHLGGMLFGFILIMLWRKKGGNWQ